MGNYSKYINLPYKELGRTSSGIDCYGLITLIFKEKLGVILPDFTELIYDKERYAVTKQEDHILYNIGLRWKEVTNPKEFDILVFNDSKELDLSKHVGLFIGDDKFIHSLRRSSSVITKLDNMFWKSKLSAILRWNGDK